MLHTAHTGIFPPADADLNPKQRQEAPPPVHVPVARPGNSPLGPFVQVRLSTPAHMRTHTLATTDILRVAGGGGDVNALNA